MGQTLKQIFGNHARVFAPEMGTEMKQLVTKAGAFIVILLLALMAAATAADGGFAVHMAIVALAALIGLVWAVIFTFLPTMEPIEFPTRLIIAKNHPNQFPSPEPAG